jgi:fermentation-respiration switch protein FrsA (DUF1100 family)
MVFVRGDDWIRELVIEDPDPDSPDPDNPIMVPRNLTGYTFKAQVRQSNKTTSPLVASLTVTGDGTGGAFGPSGYIRLHLTHEESEKCEKVGGWDLEETDPAGVRTTILGGKSDPFGDFSR